jgi:hypothetical protein
MPERVSKSEFIGQLLNLLAKDAKNQGRQDDLIKKLSTLLLDFLDLPLAQALDTLVANICDLYYHDFAGPPAPDDRVGSCTIFFSDGTKRCDDSVPESRCDGSFSEETCAQLDSDAKAQHAQAKKAMSVQKG